MMTRYHYHNMLHGTDNFFPINIELVSVPISLKIGGSAMQINNFWGEYYTPSATKGRGGNILGKNRGRKRVMAEGHGFFGMFLAPSLSGFFFFLAHVSSMYSLEDIKLGKVPKTS